MPDPSSETGADVYDVVIVGAGPAGLTAGIYASRGRLKTAVPRAQHGRRPDRAHRPGRELPRLPRGHLGLRPLAEDEGAGREVRRRDARDRGRRRAAAATPRAATSSSPTARRSARARSSSRRASSRGARASPARPSSSAAASAGAPPATAPSTAARPSPSSAAATPPSRRACSSPSSPRRSTSCTAATSCAPPPIAQERAFANPKFEFVWDSIPRQIDGAEMVEALEVENVKTGEGRTPAGQRRVHVHRPDPQHRLAQGHASSWTSRATSSPTACCAPSLPGVFACGDARANPLKQIAMAVGEGALAAVQAERYLDELESAAGDHRGGRRERRRRSATTQR